MTFFLWFMLVLGVLLAGVSIGKDGPAKGSDIFSACFWGGIGAWAGYLIANGGT